MHIDDCPCVTAIWLQKLMSLLVHSAWRDFFKWPMFDSKMLTTTTKKTPNLSTQAMVKELPLNAECVCREIPSKKRGWILKVTHWNHWAFRSWQSVALFLKRDLPLSLETYISFIFLSRSSFKRTLRLFQKIRGH